MQVVKIQHHGQLLVDSVVQSILSEDEDFVLDEDAQFVAELQEPFVGRVVRGADGVDAGLLEEEQAPLLRRAVPGRAEDAEVVVHRDAV